MITAPAHYLRENHSTRTPRCWIAFDTESFTIKDGEVGRQVWRCGHAWHECKAHNKGGKAKVERSDFDTAEAFWSWVSDRTRPRQRTVVVAHNLAYDLRISNAFEVLPSLGWSLVFVRLDGNAAWCKWERNKATIVAVDSFTWLPMGLDKIGKLLGSPKLDLPLNLDSRERWLARCRQDVHILRDAWASILDFIDTEDMGVWKPTGAGQSWAAFRHKFMTHKILIHTDEAARALEREGAWTGRTEAWRHGDQGPGTFDEWDFTTAYARVAYDCEIPVRLVRTNAALSLRELRRRIDRNAVVARVEIQTDVPLVPCRIDGRIVWPVGHFETVLWDPELRLALDAGAIVSVGEAYTYTRALALREWAGWVLDNLRKKPEDIDPIKRAIIKHWSRALIGRFGSKWSVWEDIGQAPTDEIGLSSVGGPAANGHRRMLTVGGRAFMDGEPQEPADGLPQIMAWVMSECRVRLWRAMNEAGLENVLYVDTDSIITTEEGSRRLWNANIEGLRIKEGHKNLVILGPRQLIANGRLKAAGVSSKAVQRPDGSWHSEAWRSLSTSLATGEHNTVTVTPRKQRVRGIDTRRTHLEGGCTEARFHDTFSATK